MSERWIREKRIPWLMVALLLLTAGLVWHDLGVREVLGRDENATITKLDQPNLKAVLDVTYMKITGQPGNMQPLYFLAQHLLWPLIGRSAFMLRFLNAATGILVVALTYKLGEALFGREPFHDPGPSPSAAGQAAGLVGALFVALLPLHLRYAQTARPYTLLAALSVASALFLVRALQTGNAVHWAGFVLTAVLNFYNHYNALFVLAVEGLYAGVIWLGWVAAAWRGRGSPRSFPRQRLLGAVLSFLAVGALCAPGLIRLFSLPWTEMGESVEAGGQVTAELKIPFFRHYLYMSGLKTVPVQNLFFGLTGLGLVVALARRRWQAALFGALWIAVPFVTLAMMPTPRPFEERYVIFVTPVAFLLVAYGVVSAGELVGLLGRRPQIHSLRWVVTGGLTLGLALLFVGPLKEYYVINRAADRLEQALTVIEDLARPGDVVVVSPRIFVRPLAAGGAEVLYLTDHLSDDELDGLVENHRHTWVLTSSYLPPASLQEPADQWLQSWGDRFVRVPIKSITALAYGAPATADREVVLLDRITMLEAMAAGSSGRYEAWQRYGLLAEAYQALGDLYAGQGQAALAEEYWTKAEEARAAAPPP